MQLIDRVTQGFAGIEQPEAREDTGIGGSLSRRADCARGAVSCRFDVAGEIVMAERQQGRRQDIEREDDLQPQAGRPAGG